MKMNNFNKRYNYATACKGKPTSKSRAVERKQEEGRIEDKSMSELFIVVKQMKEQITQMNVEIKLLCEEISENK